MALAEEIARAALLLHPDPHSIFGAHPEDGTTLLRVLRPGAARVALLVDGEELAASKVHPRGVFEARAPKLALPLDGSRFEIVTTDASGAVERSLDPYFFTPTIGDLDLHLFAEGTHDELYRHLGAHLREHQGARGTSFTVWAPNAASVRVVGDFNGWKPDLGAMRKFPSGVWEIFVPGVSEGALYKFEILTHDGAKLEKSDPFGREMEVRPGTASRVTASHHAWKDGAWMEKRKAARAESCPMAVYEVHLQSWRKKPRAQAPGEPPPLPEQSQRWLTYRELADDLAYYLDEMGYTHV
jgi:1,4-alpha-glucan branching enzyme